MKETRKDISSTASLLDSPRVTIVLVVLMGAMSYVVPRLEGKLMLNPQTSWPLWPGCAILVSVLLLVRTGVWPLFIIASFAGFFLYDLQVGVPINSIAWFIPADAIQALTAAIGLRYCFDRAPRLNSVNSLAQYGFFAVFLAPFAAAFVSALGIPGNYWTSFRISFLSEVLAFITLTPAILSWLMEGREWVQKPLAHHLEFAALMLATIVLGYFTFAATNRDSPALLYSLIPVLLWSSLRFGSIGISNVLFVISFLAVWGVVHGRGPFSAQEPQSNMLALQLFLIFASIPFLTLTAVVEDRKLAGDRLADLTRKLIEAQEEERKRIARDIHDDYSQRVAMLSIDVQAALTGLGVSLPRTEEELHGLIEKLSELATDMHSLSHQLHSSSLEKLGLVAGIRAFCRDFGKSEHLEVNFEQENVPRSVAPDAALCLFRVVQEALRNVKKHSETTKADVRLESSDGKLHVTVSDRGKGFELASDLLNGGIGIWSMRERLRLLGGRLEIKTHRMQGTRIDAWLPVNGDKAHDRSAKTGVSR